MKRSLSILTGVIAAALAGGGLLGAEVGSFTALDTTDALTLAEALGVGVTSGLIAIVAFAGGLLVIGLPMFLILNRQGRLNGVTSVVSGAIAATLVILAVMATLGIRDASILLGLFLLPPGALAGFVLWRLGFKTR